MALCNINHFLDLSVLAVDCSYLSQDTANILVRQFSEEHDQKLEEATGADYGVWKWSIHLLIPVWNQGDKLALILLFIYILGEHWKRSPEPGDKWWSCRLSLGIPGAEGTALLVFCRQWVLFSSPVHVGHTFPSLFKVLSSLPPWGNSDLAQVSLLGFVHLHERG